ncbi:LytR/AlgR family response regulator transcription factor [Thermodesulfovibrio hydrogeniphilus]
MSFTAIVAEDEPYARDELIYILSKFPSCQIVGQAGSSQEALAVYKKNKPDVIFLDIELPDLSGIELAKVISNFYEPSLIVFATAYDDYAIEAFELGAIDYILKPFDEKRIEKTVKRIEKLKSNEDEWMKALRRISDFVNTETPKKLPVKQKEGIINLIPYKDILFGEASESGVKILTSKNEEYFYDGTLTELELRLRKEGFFRIHKSYVVNLKKIEAIIPWFKGTYWIVLEGEKSRIPVSKSMIKELKKILGIKCS